MNITIWICLKRLALGTLLLSAIGIPLRAQCLASPNGDSSFGQDTGLNTPQFPGDRSLFVRVGRVVGPGVASEFVSEGDPFPSNRGTLANWDALKQNGVVSQFAYLRMVPKVNLGAQFWGNVNLAGRLGGVPAAAVVRFRYFINGRPLTGEYLVKATISNPSVPVTAIDSVQCLPIETRYLRFARMLPSLGGGPCPTQVTANNCPGVNEVSVRITSMWFGSASALAATAGSPSGVFSLPFLALSVQPSAIRDSINIIPSVGTLSFKAMHPVIMIHGNSSSQIFWTNQANQAADGPLKCSSPPCDPHWNFEQPFIDQYIPYFRQFTMDNNEAEFHVKTLQGIIDGVMKRFGAKYVHLVGHSKGGIDSRLWIASARASGSFPVLSMTTLATPHHGSAQADYMVYKRKVNVLASDNVARLLLANSLETNSGHNSLTTDYGRTLQQENLPQLPTTLKFNGMWREVKYYSLDSDANLDSNPGSLPINLGETVGANNLGDRPFLLGDIPWSRLIGQVYRLLWQVSEAVVEKRNSVFLGTRVDALKELHIGGPFENDFLVTRQSGQVEGRYLRLGGPSIKANHTTIANPATGLMVLNAIRQADSVQ